MDIRDLAVIAFTLIVGVVGFAFRLGHLRRLGWAYIDPDWSRSRYYANGLFTLIPGSLTFGLGCILFFVPEDSPFGAWILLLAFPLMVWTIVTVFYPARFLKPKWIRQIDSEIRDDETGYRRRLEVLQEIGHKPRR
jgi:hypothetical protein